MGQKRNALIYLYIKFNFAVWHGDTARNDILLWKKWQGGNPVETGKTSPPAP